MITEDYVSFETAKLLKKKGFDEKCQKVYMHNGQLLWAQIFMEGESFVNNECIDLVAKYNNWTENNYAFLCPTLQMTMKWLREVHNIIIEPEPIWNDKKWEYQLFIVTPLNANFPYYEHNPYKFYEKCVEAGLKYCLENLI